MIELSWLESHFHGDLRKGIDRINELEWNISIVEKNGMLYVAAGDSIVFETDSRESLDAFLYGMGLAYLVFPEELMDQVKGIVNDL